jgi:hypothetical protein
MSAFIQCNFFKIWKGYTVKKVSKSVSNRIVDWEVAVDLPEGHDVVGGPAEDESRHQGPRQLDGLHLGSTNHALAWAVTWKLGTNQNLPLLFTAVKDQ